MTKVLFYTETSGHSGAESILATAATTLRRNHSIEVGAIAPATLPTLVADLERGGIRVWPADLRPKKTYRVPFVLPWIDSHNSTIALTAVREYRPDAIVLNMPDPEECIGVAYRLRKCGVPLLGWLHLPQRLEERGVKLGRIRSELCRATLPVFDRMIVPGDGLPELLARNYGFSRKRISALPNGIAGIGKVTEWEREGARAMLKLEDPERLTICVVGRLHFASKGQDILAAALRTLGERAKRFHVVVAGSGPDEQALRGLAAQTAATWQFLGWTSNVRSVFAASDILAMPSRCEGLALTALEAADAGLPMLLSPVGANEATFPPNWLLPLDESRWAQALDRLNNANMPSASAWWDVNHERFSLDAMADQLHAIIDDVVR